MNDTNPHALILPSPPPAGTLTNAVEEQLRAVKAPVDIPGELTWLWWTLGFIAAAFLLSALVVWLYRARQEALNVPPELAYLRALRRLAEALAFINDPRLFCIEVSAILRIYLEEQFHLRAPERTTEEFLHELQGSAVLSDPQKQSLADFLTRCDLVKFARYQPAEAELRDLYNAALRLVEETMPKPPTETAPQTPAPGASQPAPPVASA